jgi:GNAT superfamily N-acetyltransferase
MFKIKGLEGVDNVKLKVIESRENFMDDDFDFTKVEIAEFLEEQLGRFGDPLDDIINSMNYALADGKYRGGLIFVAYNEDDILGAAIVNNTGMKGFIPENILVYIAVNKEYRGKGIGGKLLDEVINRVDGEVALHVEYDNPARKLYERKGFKSKYAEMRLKN